MKVLRSGFDTLDVAFRGALPAAVLEELENAKNDAQTAQAPALARIGPGAVSVHVHETGKRGGYRYTCSTGPEGEVWFFKAGDDPQDWNIFVSVRAFQLAIHGLCEVWNRLEERLSEFGATVTDESINRVDFAVDLLALEFKLEPDRFVVPPGCEVKAHFGKKRSESVDDTTPLAVFHAHEVSGITIGKMPGRQVAVYDKRREAIKKKNFAWFNIWRVNRFDRSQRVWRVELRAGKKLLKDRWEIVTYADLVASIAEVFSETMSVIRYLSTDQNDTNLSRQTVHPIWEIVQDEVTEALFEHRSGLLPGQIRERNRSQTLEIYEGLIAGLAVALAVTRGYSDKKAKARIHEDISRMLKKRFMNREYSDRLFQRARERLHFIAPSEPLFLSGR